MMKVAGLPKFQTDFRIAYWLCKGILIDYFYITFTHLPWQDGGLRFANFCNHAFWFVGKECSQKAKEAAVVTKDSAVKFRL